MKSNRGHSLGQCIRIENAGLRKLNQANRLLTQGTQQVQMAQIGFQRLNKQQGGGGTTTRLNPKKQYRRTQTRSRRSASSAQAA